MQDGNAKLVLRAGGPVPVESVSHRMGSGDDHGLAGSPLPDRIDHHVDGAAPAREAVGFQAGCPQGVERALQGMIGCDTNLVVAGAVGKALERLAEFQEAQVVKELTEHVCVMVLGNHHGIRSVTAVDQGGQISGVGFGQGHFGEYNDCFLHVPTLDPGTAAS